MALWYVNVSNTDCLLTIYANLHITSDFRHALLRKDKAKVAYRHYSSFFLPLSGMQGNKIIYMEEKIL